MPLGSYGTQTAAAPMGWLQPASHCNLQEHRGVFIGQLRSGAPPQHLAQRLTHSKREHWHRVTQPPCRSSIAAHCEVGEGEAEDGGGEGEAEDGGGEGEAEGGGGEGEAEGGGGEGESGLGSGLGSIVTQHGLS